MESIGDSCISLSGIFPEPSSLMSDMQSWLLRYPESILSRLIASREDLEPKDGLIYLFVLICLKPC